MGTAVLVFLNVATEYLRMVVARDKTTINFQV